MTETCAHPVRPTHAELIHTACMRPGAAMLAIDGVDPAPVSVVHLFDGQAFVMVGEDSAPALRTDTAGATGVPAVVEITDLAPIDLRERVRSLVWLHGTLHSVPRALSRELALEIADEHPHDGLLDLGHGAVLLRLNLASGVLADTSGAAAVTADELRLAPADPFWEQEADWVRHIESDHPELVWNLARRLPRELRSGRVRPLGIDRYGVRLRIEGPLEDSDVRVPFPAPVGSVIELSRALRTLAGCPYLNALHS